MMRYLYDGTFPGFLSAVYASYHDGTGQMEGIGTAEGARDLFAEEKRVDTDLSHAHDVAQAFFERCGGAASRWMYRAFLSGEKGREDLIFSYMRLGFRLGKALYACRTEPPVWTVCRLSRKTGAEAEKFLGLVRFRELADGSLYAAIRPDHGILPLIAGHFQRRLGTHTWAIHDLGRGEAVLSEAGKLVFGKLRGSGDLAYSEDEERLCRLWQGYYRHMAIRGRYNPALRRSFMPEKYWECLTEMTPEARAVSGDRRQEI